MSENAQRVGIIIIAIIFLLTTIAIGLYAVLFSNDSSSNELTDQQLQELLEQQQTQEEQMPQRQIEGYTPLASVAELKTEDLTVGEGAEVKPGDTVTVDYIGVLAATGEGFDNSIDRGEPATFGLDQVIAGWSEGLVGMKEGGKRRLYIPAAMAYGESSPSPLIPANSDLVFDVELIRVGQ